MFRLKKVCAVVAFAVAAAMGTAYADCHWWDCVYVGGGMWECTYRGVGPCPMIPN